MLKGCETGTAYIDTPLSDIPEMEGGNAVPYKIVYKTYITAGCASRFTLLHIIYHQFEQKDVCV